MISPPRRCCSYTFSWTEQIDEDATNGGGRFVSVAGPQTHGVRVESRGSVEFVISENCRNPTAPVRVRRQRALFMRVRREFREVLRPDLDALMDAMHTLWDVSTANGRARFGDDRCVITPLAAFATRAHCLVARKLRGSHCTLVLRYLSIDDLVLIHHQNAGQRDADHFHQARPVDRCAAPSICHAANHPSRCVHHVTAWPLCRAPLLVHKLLCSRVTDF